MFYSCLKAFERKFCAHALLSTLLSTLIKINFAKSAEKRGIRGALFQSPGERERLPPNNPEPSPQTLLPPKRKGCGFGKSGSTDVGVSRSTIKHELAFAAHLVQLEARVRGQDAKSRPPTSPKSSLAKFPRVLCETSSRDDKTAAQREALFRGGGDTFMAERARVHVTRLQTTYNALLCLTMKS